MRFGYRKRGLDDTYLAAGALMRMAKRRRTSRPSGSRTKTKVSPRLKRRTTGRTITRTKSKTRSGVVSTPNGSFSAFRFGKPLAKYLRNITKAAQPCRWTVNGSYRYTASVGTQGVVIPNYQYTLLDNTVMSDQARPFGTKKQFRMIMNQCKMKLMMTNIYQTPCEVIIYDVVARNDYFATAADGSTWDETVAPFNAWTNGLTNAAAGITQNVYQLATTPFQSEQFTKNFLVKKTTRFTLSGGATHTHWVTLTPNIILDGEDLTMKKILKLSSYWPLIITTGYPINDATTKTNVTAAASGLDFVWSKLYRFTAMQNAQQSYQFTNNLAAVTTQSFINEDTGDVDVTNVAA